ncbi:hypothetical protein [Vogesella sp. LIG4]|uniref:hypothetical protein n=1 Tax=Vogesella sp. LIG4 TaxID=1192162 RepID=UPI00081FF979|nr:hypothetical protein [Vogesella sp. LIG4]SCK23065.1 hypothetical protein PSELUDRAFT_2678 [Vogesella sp. LIG4]
MQRGLCLKKCSWFVGIVLLLLLASGCATLDPSAKKYTLKDIDSSKGVVVGTVFERSVFTPYGAYFYIQSPNGEKVVLSSGAGSGCCAIINTPPKIPKGVGSPFALQLPPGKYQVVGWALDYGSFNKSSLSPETPVEFEVIAGEVGYLGRFDANRFLEIASIHDNFEEDIVYINKSFPPLNSAPITNHAIGIKGWWLPNPAGKEVLERMGTQSNSCEQCK